MARFDDTDPDLTSTNRRTCEEPEKSTRSQDEEQSFTNAESKELELSRGSEGLSTLRPDISEDALIGVEAKTQGEAEYISLLLDEESPSFERRVFLLGEAPGRQSEVHIDVCETTHAYAPSRRTYSALTITPNLTPSSSYPPSRVESQNEGLESSNCMRCDRPDHVDHMVRCDNTIKHRGNAGWFHYSCVGLSSYDSLGSDDAWLCEACRVSRPPSIKPHHDKNTDSTNDKRRCKAKHSEGLLYKPSKISRTERTNSRSRSGKVGTPRTLLPNNDLHRVIKFVTKPLSDKKRVSEKSSSTEACYSTAKIATSRAKSTTWQQHEKDAVIAVMRDIMGKKLPGCKTEKRWQLASKMLECYNVDRTGPMVKNYWNREGRLASGIDERNKPDPSRMITGVQDPEKRRQARQAKRRAHIGISEDVK